MPSLSWTFFVSLDKVDNIVKVLNVVSSIPFKVVPNPANEIFNHVALFLLYSLIVK